MQDCPPLKITFAGTGTSSGVPMIGCHCEVCTSDDARDKRLRSSIIVQSEKTTLVIDTTPDFRYQMLRTKTEKLDAVVFTHPHKDHIAGLDDIRAYNYFQGTEIDVYANQLTQEGLKREFAYIFQEHKYPGIPEIRLHNIGDEVFYAGNIPLQPLPVWHLRMPVLGFRMGKFAYITDANRIDDATFELLQGLDILVLNALRKEEHISHFTLYEAIDVADKCGAKQCYFTHLSHQMGLHAGLLRELPPHRLPAYDGMQIFVN